MQPPEYAAFAAALADPSAPLPPGLLVPRGVSTAERFAVYRNNVHASLADALEESFPVCRALVGAPYFRAMARAHVQQELPHDAVLLEQAAGFVAFIRRHAAVHDLPWLPDVATLECAWQQCWSAADARALGIGELANLTPADLCTRSFTPHPATRLVRSRWPIGSIWLRHQQADPDLGTLDWSPESVLLTRAHAVIELLLLPAGTAAMAAALLAGRTVEDAAATAATEDPQLDPGRALHVLISSGFATEIQPRCAR